MPLHKKYVSLRQLHTSCKSDLKPRIPRRFADVTTLSTDENLPFRSDRHVATEGEFAGWTTWRRDSFESINGPFWHKVETDGRVRCAFRVTSKHLNGGSLIFVRGILRCGERPVFNFSGTVKRVKKLPRPGAAAS
jgi:hypothetical protein